jgi:hypothetical protein
MPQRRGLAGGVAFDTMDEAQIADNIDVLEKIVRKLRSQQMPPADTRCPTRPPARSSSAGSRAGSTRWARTQDPGHVGLHRMNRKEYANAVRDLLGIDIDPADILPRDEPREGFDNIAAALQVTPSFLDQYIAAARTVVVQALGNKDALPAGTTYRAQKPSTQIFHQTACRWARAAASRWTTTSADGEYVLNIANMARRCGSTTWSSATTSSSRSTASWSTKPIGGEEDMKAIDQKQDPAVEAINKRLKNIRFNAKAGVHRFVVAFRHRSFAESETA